MFTFIGRIQEAVILWLAAHEVRSAQAALWQAEHRLEVCHKMVSDAEVALDITRMRSMGRRRTIERDLGTEFVEQAEAVDPERRKSFWQGGATIARVLASVGFLLSLGMLIGHCMAGG